MSDTPTTDRIEAEYSAYGDIAAVKGIRADYEARLTEIEESTAFTEAGRKAEAAAAYLDAQEQIKAHADKVNAGIDTARNTAERRLFGPGAADPATILAHRDALERADKLGSAKAAAAALHRARFSGDDSMVRAITMRAEIKSWDGVLGDVEKAAPGTGAKLAAYRAIPPTDGATYNQTFGVRAPKYFTAKLDGAVDTRAIARAAATIR